MCDISRVPVGLECVGSDIGSHVVVVVVVMGHYARLYWRRNMDGVQPGRMGGGGRLAVSCDECGVCNFNKRAWACCCPVAKTSRYSLLALEPRNFRADARPSDAANFLEGLASRRWRWRWNRVDQVLERDITYNHHFSTTHHTHRNHGRRQEHHKPARARRCCAQIASSPQVARTKARPDERKPVFGCDGHNAGYVDLLACRKSLCLQLRKVALAQKESRMLTSDNRLLGILRTHIARLRRPRTSTARLHGCERKK